MATNDLTPEQQAIRLTGIGASEIGAVAGLDPYRKPIDVFATKLGLVPPFEGNRFTRWGQRLEAAIADAYAEEQDVYLSSPGTLRHPKRAIMLATPDRLVHPVDNGYASGPATRVLQIKTASVRQEAYWGDGPDEVPDQYLAQVAWEMAVTDLPEADLAVLIGGNDDRLYRIPRDLELEGQLIEIGERFWRDHIVTQVPPPVDGTEQYSEYLKRRFPRDDRPLLPATDEALALLRTLCDQRTAREVAVYAEIATMNQLRAMIGDTAGIEDVATWRQARPSTVTDWEAVAVNGVAKSKFKKLFKQFTKEKPGSRRFLPKFPKEK